ncbi:MAG TPA: cupin domain-containing protein [Gaiellaceae bacterium]|nr:cupin domain-containing protein [Gaiellaceae bacterium]
MKVSRIEGGLVDARGRIVDILENEPIEHVTIIESEPGAVRGNHVHHETFQWVYVVSGALRFDVCDAGGERHSGVVRAGDLLLTEPGDAHAMECIEAATMVVLTRGPRGGRNYELDTFRLDEPLIASTR